MLPLGPQRHTDCQPSGSTTARQPSSPATNQQLSKPAQPDILHSKLFTDEFCKNSGLPPYNGIEICTVLGLLCTISEFGASRRWVKILSSHPWLISRTLSHRSCKCIYVCKRPDEKRTPRTKR